MEQSVTLLKKHGLKATPQRIAIYDYLLHTEAHPTVDTIYASLHPTHPTMSLATVYKTVESLREAGLIQQLNVGEECFRYDARTSSHPHVQCLHCRRVFDLAPASFTDLPDRARAQSSFLITQAQLYFYGLCPECQQVQDASD